MPAAAYTTHGAAAGSGLTGSSCDGCSFIQLADDGSASYAITSAGVLTSFSVREGTGFAGTNQVSLQVWRSAPGGAYQLVAESPPRLLFGAANIEIEHSANLPVLPGDKIGLRTTIGGNTAAYYSTSTSGDVAGLVNAANVGDSVTPGETTDVRVNVAAKFELDADNDGFGDETQDNCLGDGAHGNTACSGSLIGTTMTNVANASAACGASNCVLFNNALAGGGLTAPYDGVIVRWRMKAMTTGDSFRLRVLRREGSDMLAVRSGSVITATATNRNIVTSASTRTPISAGDLIGIDATNLFNVGTHNSSGAGVTGVLSNLADGAIDTPSLNGQDDYEYLFNADVERDADGDGYGDESQDGCSSQAKTQDICHPDISGLGLLRSRFRVDPKGAVIARKPKIAQGSGLLFQLAGPATATVRVEQALRGRKSGSKCVAAKRSNRTRRSCTRYVSVHSFQRTLTAGSAAINYSGRYRKGRKSLSLKPGSYRFVLHAENRAASSDATSGPFVVVK